MNLKSKLLGAVAGVAFATSALAQVNNVPQVGITTGYLPKVTYSSAFFGLAPPASATDMICIAASATKTVRLDRIVLTGSAGTAVALPVQIVRRAALDTGGTAASTTANPGVTTQIASRDTGLATNLSASAVLVSYTAVPTINDSAPVYIDSGVLGLAATSVGVVSAPLVFDWSRDIENNVQIPTLAKNSTQQLCVNFNAVSITSGVLNGSLTWTEE
jgi:hypothetical protein